METSHDWKSNTKSIKKKQNNNNKNKKKEREREKEKKKGGGGENKWVFNCNLNEEYVCVRQMEKGRLFQVTGPDRRKISGLSISF